MTTKLTNQAVAAEIATILRAISLNTRSIRINSSNKLISVTRMMSKRFKSLKSLVSLLLEGKSSKA